MVTDEIVADLDWYPTIAHFTGEEERIPPDRPIDGVDQSDFILGKKSMQEYPNIKPGQDFRGYR